MRKLERLLKQPFIKLLSRIIRVQILDQVPFKSIRKILIIRQHNELGDMLCVTPLLRAIKNIISNASIDLITRPINTEVVFNNPFINRVIEYNNVKFTRSPLMFIRFIRQLRAEKYDLVIVPCTVSVSVTSDLIAYFSKAKIRIGPIKINGEKNISGFLYNFPVELDWRKETLKHQTLRNLDILKNLRITTNNLDLVLNLTHEEKEFGRAFYEKNHHIEKISIGVHPGAGKKINQWDVKNFKILIGKFIEEMGIEVFITCGPKDSEPVNYLVSIFGKNIIVIKEKSIRNVAAIISHFDLFITNDTGIMHVAATTKCPVLSLFGPTDPLQWAPQRKFDRYILGKNGNINTLTVDKVFSTAIKMLGNYQTKRDFH